MSEEQNNRIPLAGEYTGDYLHGRFNGKGVYAYNNWKYEGSFVDGEFHGEGTLYVKGGYYKGFWQRGVLVDGGFIFDDGLPYLKVGLKFWEYCSDYDPRFYSEIKDGLKVGQSLLRVTSHHHEHLPEGCYDTIDGYYDPKKHVIFSYLNNEELRTPNTEEIDFILKNCRVGGKSKHK